MRRIAQSLCSVLMISLMGCQTMSAVRSSSAESSPEKEFSISERNDSSFSVEDSARAGKPSGEPKKRIMVLDFWNSTPVKLDFLGAYAAEELKRGLNLSQRVVLPSELKVETSTEDFIQGEQIKVAQLVREGRRLGVAAILIGRVSRIIFRQKGDDVGIFRKKESLGFVEVEYKLFDVQSGREILSDTQQGEVMGTSVVVFEDHKMQNPAYRAQLIKGAIRESIARAIPVVLASVDKLSWQGRIARVQAEKVFINAGKATGIMPGDILLVQTQGDDIYDPVTGIYLGRAQGHSKGTLEVIDYLGTDGAIAKVHSGGNFQEGDVVQLY